MVESEKRHWADLAAENVIKEKGNKKEYICASGITPSGTVHIGNFREIITTELVVKALEKKGKKVKFIYSWDDYDRLRKIPENVPKDFERYIGMPLSEIPDPWKCHKSYALHFEKELEDSLKIMNMKIMFIRQNEMYKKCRYFKEIKKALEWRHRIIEILNKYRKEPLEKNWYPVTIYSEKTHKDNTKILEYGGEYKISYEDDSGYSNSFDFRKKGIVKLVWRVDWPCRWHYEKVDFEPGGKDHSTAGGSYMTGKEIIEEIYGEKAPSYVMYDFIGIKGSGGKMSSSSGEAVTLKDCLEVYEPEVIRYLFAGTRPNTEFSISFDLDVLKVYEDFDRLEKRYYSKEADERDRRIYELSCLAVNKKAPDRINFRHLSMLVQVYNGDVLKVSKNKEIQKRALCTKNWLEKYAPDEFKFKVHEKISKEIIKLLNEKQKEALGLLIKSLEKDLDEEKLFNEFYSICESVKIDNTEFFKGAYLALIGKEKGPRLASFILAIGKEKVIKLLKEIK